MEKQVIHTPHAPEPVGPYSQAIAATGEMLFLSGQIPLDPAGNLVGGDDVVAQTHQVMQNLLAVLEAAGANFDNVVKVGIFLSDMNDFQAMNEVYADYLGDAAPARATVQVARLPKDVRVEIDCIAVL